MQPFSGEDVLADSPYRVRGGLYLGTRSYFEHNVQGGFASLLSSLRPALRAFMAQPFRKGGFYEVMDCPELIDVEARVCGLPVPRYLDRRTRWQAQRDLSGLTALVLRVAPPHFFVSRIAQVMTETFNFGISQVTKLGPRQLHVEITGVPVRLAPWLEHSVAVYGVASVEGAGWRDVEVRPMPPTRLAGGQSVQLHIDVRWGDRSPR